MHVDEMTEQQRFEFRSEQLADLAVLVLDGEVGELSESVRQLCADAARELLVVAVVGLAQMYEASGAHEQGNTK